MNSVTETVRLTTAQVTAIRQNGGFAFVPHVEFVSARVRPWLGTPWRTEELAQAELDRLCFRQRETSRRVSLVDVHGNLA